MSHSPAALVLQTTNTRSQRGERNLPLLPLSPLSASASSARGRLLLFRYRDVDAAWPGFGTLGMHTGTATVVAVHLVLVPMPSHALE